MESRAAAGEQAVCALAAWPWKQHHKFKVEQRGKGAAARRKRLLEGREKRPLSKGSFAEASPFNFICC